jgi:hypothetical protein
MKQTFKNVDANKAKEAMVKNVAKVEKKYIGRLGQEWVNQYRESTSKIVDFLIDGIKTVHQYLTKEDGLITAVTVDFLGKTRAVVSGLKNDDGSIEFKICSTDDNIPTFCSDMFNAVFNQKVVDLVFNELKGTKSSIELVPLKKENNDISKFFKDLVDVMSNNASENEVFLNGKKIA